MAYDLFERMQDVTASESSLVNQNSSGYDLGSRMNGDPMPASTPAPAKPEGWFGEFTNAFGTGVDQLQSMSYGAGALAASWIGWDGARDAFMKGYEANEKQIAQHPETVESFKDVDSFDTAIRYGLAKTGEFAPLVAQSLVTGVIGSITGSAAEPGAGTIAGGVTGIVARKAVTNLLKTEVKDLMGEAVVKEVGEYAAGRIAKSAMSEAGQKVLSKEGLAVAKSLGSTAAVGLSNVGIMQGALYGEMANNPDMSEQDKKLASTVGGLLAALPMTGVMTNIGKSFMPGVTEEFLKSAIGQKTVAEQSGYLTRFLMTGGKEMIKNFGHTGAAMFTQTAINLAAKKWADPNTRWEFLSYGPKEWDQLIESSIAGGVGGMFIGGPLSTLGKMASHPDPVVRSSTRDILGRAEWLKIPSVETTPEHEALSKTQGRIGEIESAINGGKLSPEELIAHQEELVKHQATETELSTKLFGEEKPLVNQTEGLPSHPPEESTSPLSTPNKPSPGPSTDAASVESLRALYADKMPYVQKAKQSIPDIEQKAMDKHAEVHAHIESIAGGTEYGEQLKKAFTPEIITMMAAEDIRLKTESESGKKDPLVYAATINDKGQIEMFVPDAKHIEREAEAKSQLHGGETERVKKDLATETESVIAHEVVHLGDLINIRNDWLTRGKPDHIRDFARTAFEARGSRMRKVFPAIKKIGHLGYHMGEAGRLSDLELGQELPRMAVEMARRGQTSEVTEALLAAARNDNKLNGFMRDWIDSLKTIRDTIKKWLTPGTEHPDLKKSYDDINATLDKYGVLVNQKLSEASPESQKAMDSYEKARENISAEGKKASPAYQKMYDEIKSGNISRDGKPDNQRMMVQKAMNLGVVNNASDLEKFLKGRGDDSMHTEFARRRKQALKQNVHPRYEAQYARLQAGDLTLEGEPSKKMEMARVAMDHGIVNSPADLQKWLRQDDAMHKEFARLNLRGETPNVEPLPKPVLDEPLVNQKAEPEISKPVSMYSQFRQAIKSKGSSDVVRSYLDWQRGKRELTTKSDIAAARLDLLQRAPNVNMGLDRFTQLVKEHNESTNKLAARKSSASDKTTRAGDVFDLPVNASRQAGPNHPVAKAVAEKVRAASAGAKLAAIREHIAENHPELIRHVESIVDQVKKFYGKEPEQSYPIRGGEVAEYLKENAPHILLATDVNESTRSLLRQRGIEVLFHGEDIPEGVPIVDVFGMGSYFDRMGVEEEGRPDFVPEASVKWPETIDNKLKEAQATDGIPETHPLIAFDVDTINHDLVSLVDEHFGENGWIMKYYGKDAGRGEGVMFAESIKQVLSENPHAFDDFDLSEVMVQKLHDVEDFNRVTNAKIQEGMEMRVHVMTDANGQAHVVPFSTYHKLGMEEAMRNPMDQRTPILARTPDIDAAHDRAIRSIMSLPVEDRSGQMYGLDLIRLKDGSWGTIENNPTDRGGASGYLIDNPLSVDALAAGLMGERPIHAELADVVRTAIAEDGVLVNQSDDLAARRPDLTKKAQKELQKLSERTDQVFRDIFQGKNMGKVRSETKERGAAGDFDHMTPESMEYQTRSKTLDMLEADSVVRERGLYDVTDSLIKNPLGLDLGLSQIDEMTGAPNGTLGALYGNVLQRLDFMGKKLAEEGGDRKTRIWVEDTQRQIRENLRNIVTPLGRFGSITGTVDQIVNGTSARESYVTPIMAHLEKVLGAKGARFIKMMGKELNQLMSDMADKVVTRPEVIATLEHIAKLSRTKKWQDEARKTATATESKARNIIRRMASRAAEHVGMDELGDEWVAEMAERATKKMDGMPVTPDTKTEVQVFQEAVNEVIRENAKRTGLMVESEGKPASPETKLAAILKNNDLYSDLVTSLRKKMIEEYKPEPGSEFAQRINEFTDYMADRSWSEGMVESLVNKNLREFETSFAKIAREHYGLSDFRVENFKEDIRKAMIEKGVENEGLLDLLVEDAESAMRSKIEESRLNFLGSQTGVSGFLKTMQTSVAQKAKEHASASAGMGEKLRDYLSEDLGIPDTDEMPLARMLEDVMHKQYNDMLGDKRKEIVDRMVQRATDGKSDGVKAKAKNSVDKILELANLGVMRDENAYNALAEKFGLPKFSEEIADKVMALGDIVATAPNVRIKHAAMQNLSRMIASQKGIRPYDMFMSGLYVNFLSGLSTHAVNVTSNTASLMGHVGVSAVQDLVTNRGRHIPAMLRALIRTATGSAQVEMRETLFTGMSLHSSGDKFYADHSVLEMKDPKFVSDFHLASDLVNQKARGVFEKIAQLSHKVYTALGGKWVGRALSAVDVFFYKMAEEASFAVKTGETETHEMRSSALVEAENQMRSMGMDPNADKASARTRQVLANQIINEWRIQNADGTINERKRIAWLESHSEALDATFRQDPKGLLGKASKLIETWTRGSDGVDNPIGRMLIPFTRIAANVTNQMLEWTPYGMVRYGIGHLYGEDFRLRDENGKAIGRDPKVLIRASLGTLGGIGLMGLFAQHHDDDDPFIAVYDDGSKNPQKRRQMMDMGWRPKTIKAGKGYYSYVATPFSMVFSIMGRMFDDYRDGKVASPFDVSLSSASVAMLQAVTHESFLSSMTDFMGAVDSPNPEKRISRLLSRTATAPFIPNMARQIDKWLNPSVQQADGFWENFIKEMPVARNTLMESLNTFGEPLKQEPGLNFLPGLGRFLTMQKTDDPVYNVLGEKRITVPGYSKSTRLGDTVMNQDQFHEYVKLAGPRIRAEIQSEIPQLRGMTKEQAQEHVNEIARRIKEEVRDQMRGSR